MTRCYARYISGMTGHAYYEADTKAFFAADEDAVLGLLAARHGFALEHEQKYAWQSQIRLLRRYLPQAMPGRLYFEFFIPRMGKRADVVLVIGGTIFVIEFKVGATRFPPSSCGTNPDCNRSASTIGYFGELGAG